MPAPAYLLQVEAGRVVVWDMTADRCTPIASRADLDAYLDAEAARLNVDRRSLQVYHSSTMDFPADSTKDPAVIALVAELNPSALAPVEPLTAPVPKPAPTAVHRTATVVQFRARDDLYVNPSALTNLSCRITTFKGTLLGTTGDGYDVVAAFPFETYAERFLDRYLDGEREPLGTYVVAGIAL